MQKRRLQQARLVEKRTYKMYKKGRLWLVAGLSTLTIGTGLAQLQVKADTTSTATSQTETTEVTGTSATLTTKATVSTSTASTESDTATEQNDSSDGTQTTSTDSNNNVATTSANSVSVAVEGDASSTTSSSTKTSGVATSETNPDTTATLIKTRTKTNVAETVSVASFSAAIASPSSTSRAAVTTVATVNSATKTYDGKTDTPNRYTVTLADGTKAPADWAATSTANIYTVTDLSDVDTAKFSSEIGTYTIALSTTGITKLSEANNSADITAANVVTGTLTIEQAPVPSAIITIGSASINYGDATPSAYTITVPSQYKVPSAWTLASSATDGTTNTYMIASDSGDIVVPTATESGTYQLTLSNQGLVALQQANPNDAITADAIITGQLVIAAHDLITMGATTVMVNKTLSVVQATVNSRAIVVPADWTISYDDTQTDAIVYNVPIAYTTYSEVVNSGVVGKYTITLTDAAMTTLSDLNNTTFDSTTVGDGVVLVKTSTAVILSPANYGAQASVETPISVLTISHARTRGIDLSYGQALYLILPLLNISQSETAVNNLTEYIIVPSGFKVATTASDGAVQVATDPVSTLTAAIETMMTQNNVTYQGLVVTQLTDYNDRQTFQIHFDQTSVYNGGSFSTLKYTLLPVIAVQSSGVTSGLIGNQVSSPDSAVVYVTDDPNETDGSYSLTLQNYTNIDRVADALGIADAVTIGSGFTDYLYHYTLSAKTITDTYQLVGNDGAALGTVTYTGDSGATYVPMTKLPTTITQDGVTYYLNTNTVASTQNYSGDENTVYTVTYQRYVTTSTDATARITIAPASKVYDNDATTDPSSYTVYLPTEYGAPSNWTIDDTAVVVSGTTAYHVSTNYLDITTIDQNVGTYAVTLNAAGMAALAAANPNLLIAGNVNVGGTLTITKRPVTIALPDTILWANGQEQNIIPVITGVVAGQTIGYTLTSGLTDPGTKMITVTLTSAAVNNNYEITNPASGELTVGAVTVVYNYGYQAADGTFKLTSTISGTVTHGVNINATDYLNYTTSDTAAAHNKIGYTLQPGSTGYQADGTLTDVGGQVVYTYLANTEKITVVYVDQDQNNATLKRVPLSGSFSTSVNYTTANDIEAYEELGYVLVSDQVPTSIRFDQDTEQTYYVYLTHGTTTVTVDHPGRLTVSDLTTTSQRIINYVYADQTPTGLDNVIQTVGYTRTAIVDAVDGTLLSYGNWTTSATGGYPVVVSPIITGYTADTATVAAAMPASVGEVVTKTVIYTVNPETIKIQFIDETTGNQVLATVELRGNYGDSANYTATADIAKYEKLGYELASSDLPNQLTYNQDDPTYRITLVHRRVTVSVDHPGQPGQPIDTNYPGGPKYPADTGRDSLQQTVTRTIMYQYATGKLAAATVNQSVTFERTATFDMVTGKQLIYSDWVVAPGQTASLAVVTSPTITGYQASAAEVGAITVTSQSELQPVVITYTAKPEVASIVFVDVTSGDTLATRLVTGDYDTVSDYSPASQIAAYKRLGYQLTSNNVPITGISFDQDDVMKVYTVKLTHQLTTVTPTKPGEPGQPIDPTNPDGPKYPVGTGIEDLTTRSKRIINYVYGDGQNVAPTVAQTVIFHRTATFDQVTKKVTYTDWDTAEATVTGAYATIDSPVITGYTPSAVRVDGITVKAGDADVQQTVVYQANIETAMVTYIDVTVGHQLGASVTLTGLFGTQADYQPASVIAQYVKAGYVLMSNDYPSMGAVFNQDGVVQRYTVYLAHNKLAITDQDQLTKTVTQTVHYQDQSGQMLQTDTIRALTFTRSGIEDAVTGVATYRDWEPTVLNFTALTAPTIAKYHVLTVTTQAVTITADSVDDVQTLTYVLDNLTPTEPTKPIEPTKPVEPTGNDDLLKPAQSTTPAKSVHLLQPTKSTTIVKADHVTTSNQLSVLEPSQTAIPSRANAVKATPIIKTASEATVQTNKTRAATSRQLPQTSESRRSELMTEILGVTLATLLLGFGELKRKHYEK